MRKIDTAVIHCSATPEGRKVEEKDIEAMHAKRFKKIGGKHVGYHVLIYLDGTIVQTKGTEHIGQHVAGANSNTIGICYIGGTDKAGKAKDTRTDAQKASLEKVCRDLKRDYPEIKFKGHRDYSPDLDGDGIIEPFEFLKSCPSFDVKEWIKSIKL
jgi:N-acetyl-anhydromuramyl-L-alanine amidase AmpD